MVDPVWAGVVGALGGAVVGSLTSLAAPLITWKVDKKRLDFERESARLADGRAQTAAEAEHARALALAAAERERSEASELTHHRRNLIVEWRIGLHDASREYQQLERNRRNFSDAPDPADSFLPVPGRAWFESLRPHLRLTTDQIDGFDEVFNLYESDLVASEISRIERVWGLSEPALDDPETRTMTVNDA